MKRQHYISLGVVGLVAVAAVVFAATRRMGQATEIDQDYRNGKPVAEPWKVIGEDAAELVRSEDAGLRFAVPAGRKVRDPHVGIAMGAGIHGDFDLSCGYEVIAFERPTTGWGNGFEMFIMTDAPDGDAYCLERMVRMEGNDVYWTSHNTGPKNARRYKTAVIPAAGTTGRLRVTRTGRTVTAWVAEGTDDYRAIGQADLGPEDVKMLRFGAHPGVGNNAVDVRITDVKVSYKPSTAVAPTASSPQKKDWLPHAEIIGLEITLALVIIWGIARRYLPANAGREAGGAICPITPGLTAGIRRGLAAIAALCIAGLLSLGAVYAMPRPRPPELQDMLAHDFRGEKLLPEGLTYYNDGDSDFIKTEPDGTRITLPLGYQHPWGGVGFQMKRQFSGDFEVTATVEILRADVPRAGFGVGAAVRIEKVGYPNTGSPGTAAASTLARIVKPGGDQVASWDIHYAAHPGEQLIYAAGGAPCSDSSGRLRLRRVGTMIYYEWARGATGDNFEEIDKREFGLEDVARVRLTALNGQQRIPVDVRLLDLRIRCGAATAGSRSHRWHAAAAMLLTVGLLVSASHWLGGRPAWRTEVAA
jgi:hypothetical protein